MIPKGGGRRFSGKPYVVAGRTYVPRDDAKGYVREGLASWYGSAVAGQQVWDTYLNFPGKITIDADDKVTVTFDSDEQTE